MRRAILATITSALLLAATTTTALAGASQHIRDNHVGFFCQPLDETVLDIGGDVSEVFGPFALFRLWVPPASPDVDPPTAFGETTDVVPIIGDGTLAFEITYPATNDNGDDLGSASLSIEMVADGDPIGGEHTHFGNHQLHVVQSEQRYEGTGTLTFDGTSYALACLGDVTEIRNNQNNPTAEVLGNAGIEVACEWEVGDRTYTAFALESDLDGLFASALIEGPETFIVGSTEDVTINTSEVAWTTLLDDFVGGTQITATFQADVEVVGGPVTSWITHEHSQERLIQTGLSVDGTYALSSGETLSVDDEACDADIFSFHRSKSFPNGGKPGAAPSNDTPAGAIALKVGSKVNAQTGGAVFEPEAAIVTCPEGEDDRIGKTVWYTFTGTGGEVTIDTSGSGFDTLVAVYTGSGGAFTEVACQDDVESEPVGISLQAVLTLDTEAGVTYWVQAGGFAAFFDPTAESGRLRLAIR